MTELEKARAHLRKCQWNLEHYRRHGDFVETIDHPEQCVLAALSRLWEAQEAIRIQGNKAWLESLQEDAA